MLYHSWDRRVTIFEVLENDHGGAKAGEERRRRTLISRHIYSTDNEWQTFEVTEAVQKWHHAGSPTHQLEVQIENQGEEEHRGGGKIDIDVNSDAKHEPLLIVFSDDQSRAKKEEKQERSKIKHGQMSGLQELGVNDFHPRPSEEKLLQIRSNVIYDSTSRIRRNAKGSSCKKTSLHVDFKEIGWDSWIIAPPGYDAYQCKGTCAFPLEDNLTTTHAMARTLVRLKNPMKAVPVCCVPTKLAPISLLYLENGVVTFKLQYEGMSVSECGCR